MLSINKKVICYVIYSYYQTKTIGWKIKSIQLINFVTIKKIIQNYVNYILEIISIYKLAIKLINKRFLVNNSFLKLKCKYQFIVKLKANRYIKKLLLYLFFYAIFLLFLSWFLIFEFILLII